MDAATTVAVYAFLGTVITAVLGAGVAIYVNRAEKKQSAETALEKTLRERLLLRDEQLADLRQDLAEAHQTIEVQEHMLEKLRGKGPTSE